jgi:hypothetical protein
MFRRDRSSIVEDVYTEKLAWFKQNEKPEALLLVADNPELIKIVVAWTSLDVKHTDKLTGLPGNSESEAWEWLWQNSNYHLSELKEKIGTSLSEIALGNKMRPLIGNRIIYPDGMVNSFVERYLREQVVKLFEAKPKKSVKKG